LLGFDKVFQNILIGKKIGRLCRFEDWMEHICLNINDLNLTAKIVKIKLNRIWMLLKLQEIKMHMVGVTVYKSENS